MSEKREFLSYKSQRKRNVGRSIQRWINHGRFLKRKAVRKIKKT
jgi:hypothetical protein